MPIEESHIMEELWSMEGTPEFNAMALRIFRHQVENCAVYQRFCQGLNRTSAHEIRDIPFLPISTFKTHKVVSNSNSSDSIFESSGTSGLTTARHHVTDLAVYENSFKKGFERAYGEAKEWRILALLPSYLERDNSSLVYMVNELIESSKHPESGFYLDDLKSLVSALKTKTEGRRTMLIGVTFALLDLIEQYDLFLPELIVMETGGMKGRRKEMTREDLHARLERGFGVAKIHSEYGMTELLSQAYSSGNGLFTCPPWMKVQVREVDDPFQVCDIGRTGGLNIIDLANLNSCSFIATDDLGRMHADGRFEVLGRFDHSDIRGCSLLSI